MKALLLAAGEGTRLRPLTLDRPKPMLPIGDRPMLEYLVTLLREHRITEIAINLHYKPEVIVNHFGDGGRFGVSITYSYEQQLLGSAGAARQLDWFFGREPFVVLYGDVLANVNLSSVLANHQTSGADGTLVLYEVEDPTRCGIVELDQDQRVTRFVEKPARDSVRGNLANAGIYVLGPRVLDLVPRGRAVDFGADIFPLALSSGQVLRGVRLDGYLLDIGSPERYAQAQADVADGRFGALLSSDRSLAVGGVR